MYSKFRWTRVSEDRIAVLKAYEPIQPYVLFELANAVGVDTFVDVGANIGVYSIFMSSLESVEAVHSFEPSSLTFTELAKNVELNVSHSKKILLSTMALSDSAQSVRFGIVGEYSGANSIINGSIHSADRFRSEELVDCVSLDSLAIKTSGKLCIKIDVEGHEKQVLMGAEALLNENSTIIQIESYREDDSHSRLLEGWGYRKVLAIGPDWYYTNIEELPSDMLITVLENASKNLIASNLEAFFNRTGPIKVQLLPGVQVELSGIVSTFARNAKQRVLARLSKR